MSDGAGGLEGAYEQRGWRDRVEGRFARLEAQYEHGEKQHDRHREDIRDLRRSIEQMFEKVSAEISAEIERENAQSRLEMAQQIAAIEKANREALADFAEEVRQQMANLQSTVGPPPPAPAPPAPVSTAQTQPIAWRAFLVAGGIGAGALMVVGFVLGLIVKLQTVADIAAGAVKP